MQQVVQRTGIDLLDIDRLTTISPKIRQRFLERVYTSNELAQAGNSDSSLSGLFCTKEAVSKALGCGIGIISWKEIEILADEYGAPNLTLHGKAAQLSASIGLQTWAVSITHTRQFACASVVAFGLITDDEDIIRK
jgi:holo-[acyl-carrier protein] synthase